MGDQVSEQTTTFGMLWTEGETPAVRALEENMVSYFTVLQGLALLSHGSRVGAGPTLSSCIHASVKRAVDTSCKLSIPQSFGAHDTNITAIGQAMTQVAVSMEDVVREMNKLNPTPSEGQEDSQTHFNLFEGFSIVDF
ncbi:uncharacterized protein LOC103956281 [Pyrus x bretschneideri]|uniref:uncharacterized protein LOC103956281 n=1 Tax=Pyrus x bretschneideri TaxID=225117 RepID=UPI000510B9D1|nr:uncharacterized protein LOC103956281 [Pyrus x bretschneideri]